MERRVNSEQDSKAGSGWSCSPGTGRQRAKGRACLQSKMGQQCRNSGKKKLNQLPGKGAGREASVFLVLKELQSSENLKRKKNLSLRPFSKAGWTVIHWLLRKVLEGSPLSSCLFPVNKPSSSGVSGKGPGFEGWKPCFQSFLCLLKLRDLGQAAHSPQAGFYRRERSINPLNL